MRTIVEQFGCELKYIQGTKKIVNETLTRLDLESSHKSEPDTNVFNELHARKLADSFASQKNLSREDQNLPPTAFPISFRLIAHSLTHKIMFLELSLGETKIISLFAMRIIFISQYPCNPRL